MTLRGNECGHRTTSPDEGRSDEKGPSVLSCSSRSSEKMMDSIITTDVLDVTGWDIKRVYRLLLAHSNHAHSIRLKNGSNYFVLTKCPRRLLRTIASEITEQASEP